MDQQSDGTKNSLQSKQANGSSGDVTGIEASGEPTAGEHQKPTSAIAEGRPGNYADVQDDATYRASDPAAVIKRDPAKEDLEGDLHKVSFDKKTTRSSSLKPEDMLEQTIKPKKNDTPFWERSSPKRQPNKPGVKDNIAKKQMSPSARASPKTKTSPVRQQSSPKAKPLLARSPARPAVSKKQTIPAVKQNDIVSKKKSCVLQKQLSPPKKQIDRKPTPVQCTSKDTFTVAESRKSPKSVMDKASETITSRRNINVDSERMPTGNSRIVTKTSEIAKPLTRKPSFMAKSPCQLKTNVRKPLRSKLGTMHEPSCFDKKSPDKISESKKHENVSCQDKTESPIKDCNQAKNFIKGDATPNDGYLHQYRLLKAGRRNTQPKNCSRDGSPQKGFLSTSKRSQNGTGSTEDAKCSHQSPTKTCRRTIMRGNPIQKVSPLKSALNQEPKPSIVKKTCLTSKGKSSSTGMNKKQPGSNTLLNQRSPDKKFSKSNNVAKNTKSSNMKEKQEKPKQSPQSSPDRPYSDTIQDTILDTGNSLVKSTENQYQYNEFYNSENGEQNYDEEVDEETNILTTQYPLNAETVDPASQSSPRNEDIFDTDDLIAVQNEDMDEIPVHNEPKYATLNVIDKSSPSRDEDIRDKVTLSSSNRNESMALSVNGVLSKSNKIKETSIDNSCGLNIKNFSESPALQSGQCDEGIVEKITTLHEGDELNVQESLQEKIREDKIVMPQASRSNFQTSVCDRETSTTNMVERKNDNERRSFHQVGHCISQGRDRKQRLVQFSDQHTGHKESGLETPLENTNYQYQCERQLIGDGDKHVRYEDDFYRKKQYYEIKSNYPMDNDQYQEHFQNNYTEGLYKQYVQMKCPEGFHKFRSDKFRNQRKEHLDQFQEKYTDPYCDEYDQKRYTRKKNLECDDNYQRFYNNDVHKPLSSQYKASSNGNYQKSYSAQYIQPCDDRTSDLWCVSEVDDVTYCDLDRLTEASTASLYTPGHDLSWEGQKVKNKLNTTRTEITASLDANDEIHKKTVTILDFVKMFCVLLLQVLVQYCLL